jgi:hypothetical protein
LLGDRRALKQPLRLGERIAIPIARILAPLLPGRYKPVQAGAVAAALVRTVPVTRGLKVLSSNELIRIGGQSLPPSGNRPSG